MSDQRTQCRMNSALFCTDSWHQVVHLFLTGVMVNILFLLRVVLITQT
jgi:hypothetical protein